MNSYERHQEERREYYLNKAQKAKQQAAAAHERADKIASFIPPGQPILVGHHSEKRHRKDLEKIDHGIRASINLNEKAEYYEQKAASVGKAGISSDDPDAIKKLKDKLTHLQQRQEFMKKVNRAHKAYQKNPAALDRYDLAEHDKEIIRKYTPRYSWEPHPFPPYELSNNNANMRRIKERIEKLERLAQMETKTLQAGEIEIIQNTEENRLQIFFPGKPDQETRTQLKRNGFRWSPTRGCWQAYLNNRAIHFVNENYLKKES